MLKSIVEKIRQNSFFAMVLCCVLPLIVIFTLSSFGFQQSWGYYALFLLCPLAHVLMFKNSHAKQAKEVVKKASIKF